MTAWVAITGGIASGKSAAAAYLSSLGVPEIDTDVISRALTAPGGAALPDLRAAFGEAVFTDTGTLNRAALRAQIAADATAKARLESVLHPLIFTQVAEQKRTIENAAPAAAYGLIAIPLLVEAPQFQALADRVLLIVADEAVRIRRLAARNGFSENEARQMLRLQVSEEERLRLADDVIENNGSLNELHRALDQLHLRYQERFAA